MSFTPTPFAELDPDRVALFEALAAESLAEDNPALDAANGVLGEIVVLANAGLHAQVDLAIESYLKGRSLRQIVADPTGVPDGSVDDVMSNYRVTRPPGEKATGSVTVELAKSVPTVVPPGAVFVAGGRRFVTVRVYTAKPPTLPAAGDNELPMRAQNGRFAFDLPVQAEAAGGGRQVRRGALVTPESPPLNFVTAYATGDFVGGYDAAANEEMLTRLQEGVAAKTPSNRPTLRGMMRADARFARVVRVNSVGCGDAEMGRDAYWIFPVSGGGKTDLYARTADLPDRPVVVKTAVRVGDSDGLALMQFSIGRDEFPGFYEVASVRPADAAGDLGSLTLVSDVRSADTTGYAKPPELRAVDAAYTRFQAAVIRFVDHRAEAPAAGGSADYAVELVTPPLVAELHDYLTAPARGGLLADLLVRAAVPCFVRPSVRIDRPSDGPDVDVGAVAVAIAGAVNAVGFSGRLHLSALTEAAYAVLPAGAKVVALDAAGRLRYPLGDVRYLSGGDLLEVPDDPAARVSGRTVQFFCQPEDVTVAVTAVPGAPD